MCVWGWDSMVARSSSTDEEFLSRLLRLVSEEDEDEELDGEVTAGTVGFEGSVKEGCSFLERFLLRLELGLVWIRE